jgi:hypothetical protein
VSFDFRSPEDPTTKLTSLCPSLREGPSARDPTIPGLLRASTGVEMGCRLGAVSTDDELPAPGRVPERSSSPDLPPQEIAELAEACRQYVFGAEGVELDYMPETLPLVDHYLSTARSAMAERPELSELVKRSTGAYFGEVLRRLAPAFWLVPSGDAHDWLVCFRDVFLAINPVAVAWDALAQSSEHGGPSSELRLDREESEAVERRLAAMPEVSEEEYFLLSTRAEVVEIVIDELRLAMQRSGTDDVSFEAADYEDFPKPIGSA